MSLLLFLIVQNHIETEDQKLSDSARWSIIQRKVQERNVVRAFSIFRENGLEPVLIKGFAAAVNYPANIDRPSIDLDLAVSAGDFSKAEDLVKTIIDDGLAIDLHRELRHLDTVEWSDLFANSRVIETDGGSYRVLRAEDHFRVLCVHWLNDGGVSRDRLWDIYYLIESRTADFDWNRALNIVGPTRRRWLICILGLVHNYLGLDLSGTPVQNEIHNIPAWLTRAVEKEWARDRKLIPLWLLMKEPKMLAEQIMFRLNPSPIQATVEMEGSFDARTRIFYKIGNFGQRLFPSLKRNVDSLGR